MAIASRKFRELVFLLLYSLDVGKGEEKDIIAMMMKELSLTRKNVFIAMERSKNILDRHEDLDALIKIHSKSYEFERIPTVEKNVLRLSLYELFHDPEIPPKVAIAEGIRLAKKFGSKESATFVNGVLDDAYQTKKGTDETQDE